MGIALFGETLDEVQIEDACDRIGISPEDRAYVLIEYRKERGRSLDPHEETQPLMRAAIDLAIVKNPTTPGVEPDVEWYGDRGCEEYAKMILFARDTVAKYRAEKARNL